MKIKTIIFILIFLFAIVIFWGGSLGKDIENSNSWTKALCNYDGEELDQRIIYDTCLIEGEEYRAKFVGTGEYYNNLTNSDEVKRWRLIKK